MEQYLEFAANHYLLVGAFFAILAALIWNLVSASGGSNIDPADATLKINHEDAVVVDVRSIKEFSDGHILHAENIPLNSLKDQLPRLEKFKQRPVIVVCRSGSRSGAAASMLRKAGFEQAYNLRGGMLAWENAGLPVTRKH
ncbi:MAG: rhodanese-like domain-containing protein [Gammaproteobacteria bacterium]|nr:MAG: rhodanese-like domain-containing protein [Gammaproteobacteria bacterium]